MRTLLSTSVVVLLVGALCRSLVAGQDRGVGPSVPTLRADVDLVLVNVIVTDSRNRFIGGLTGEHFRIWEDKVEQDILVASKEDTPISLGIVFDQSGSMGTKTGSGTGQQARIDETRLAAFGCLKDGLRDDQFFLVEFSDTPQVTRDFTNDPGRLREKLLFAGAGGRTALWDAIYAGVAKMDKALHSRKALLVLTDGLENNSRYTLAQVRKVLLEKDVRIYSMATIATFDALNSLSRETGGAVLKNRDTCEELRAEIRTQYVIGYRSTNRNKDGKFRRITVRMNNAAFPKRFPDLKVRAKEGYFATP